jgi:predicted transcriptional regulator
LEILKVLWEQGEASVRQVHDRLCPNGELAFNTTQTLLRIMEEKGLVTHRNQGRTFIYRPTYSRQRASASFLSMLEAENHTPDQLRELERLIAKARRKTSQKNK